MSNLINGFNERLKNLKTLNELHELENDLEATGEGLVFVSKRSRFRAYGFSEYNNKIHYLLSDGVSTRLCGLDKLYRYITVANICR